MGDLPGNTSRRDPLVHLLGLIAADGYIERMEAAGQRQLVNSASLPCDADPDEDAYLALGFTFGSSDANDRLFRPATLPEGWSKEASDEFAEWSYVVDEHGRRRVSVLYKAAFYDRRAEMWLLTARDYAHDLVDRGGRLVVDDWCTREALVEALHQVRADAVTYRHEPDVAAADRYLAELGVHA